jgi:hypothetical protein
MQMNANLSMTIDLPGSAQLPEMFLQLVDFFFLARTRQIFNVHRLHRDTRHLGCFPQPVFSVF